MRLILAVLLLVGCGGSAVEPKQCTECHSGNYKIVDDRYQFCNELGDWEDGGKAPK